MELQGKTLGVIGLGRIGKLTADKAAALGMNVIYTNRSGHAPENEPHSYVSMDALLAHADFISIHAQGAERPILGAAEIARMKRGVFLINTARGNLICEDALLDALDSGQVAAAALDVFREEPCRDERIYTHPQISLTPHIGASTVEAQQRIGEQIVALIQSRFDGQDGA